MNNDQYNSYSFLLDRTARKVKHYAQQQFRALGLNITVDQWIVLKQLHEQDEMKQNELAELVNKDNPTLTRIIDLLCNKELALRKAHPNDRRSFVVCLTKTGTQMVLDISPKVQNIRLKAWEGLNQKDFKHFKKVLDTIYDNLN